ncbi:hypothetical protein T265_14317, partial [Opisthorchis viverrini]
MRSVITLLAEDVPEPAKHNHRCDKIGNHSADNLQISSLDMFRTVVPIVLDAELFSGQTLMTGGTRKTAFMNKCLPTEGSFCPGPANITTRTLDKFSLQNNFVVGVNVPPEIGKRNHWSAQQVISHLALVNNDVQ